MSTTKLLFLAIFCLPVLFSCSRNTTPTVNTDVNFERLTCNAQQNPIAVETLNPLFSWVISAKGFNKSQSAYEVLVATTESKLNESEADMWNSGTVKSANSIHVKYTGAELLPLKKYYWKVKIWDESGVSSSWSPVQTFEMGLMNESNWGNAQWISLNKDNRTSEHRFREYKTGTMDTPEMVEGKAAAYFRNKLNIERKVKSAAAYICGLGYYELYLNGKKVGNHLLDPAPSNYDKQAYYVKYDVTNLLKSGQNAAGILLGNGFYGQDISWKSDKESQSNISYGSPAVKLLIQMTYDDGSTGEFYTDKNWKELTGPIVFNNIYGGDTYDARFELNGWNTSTFNDKNWGNVKVVSPKINKVSAQQIPPIRAMQELLPQRVFKSHRGTWIVDFGQNIAGWVKINVKENSGQLIEITTTETLTQDGKDIFQGTTGGGANGMPQIYKYICKGSGVESWEPKFSYHGFRYAEISGISTMPDSSMIKAVLVATDIEKQGSFECSDSLLNKMDVISKWTIEGNIHGIPEDCPHREKCGWLGDAHAFCEYALYNYDMENFYKKYMEDIRTQMRPVKSNGNASILYNVPTMIAPGKRESTIAKLDWGIATIYLPYYNYKYYGGEGIIKEYYEDMKGLTSYYLSFKDKNGIVQNGMGDWCPPNWDRRQNPDAMECDPVISANAYFYDILGIMELFAVKSNDAAFEAIMKNEKTALREAFDKQFLEEIPTTKHKWYGSQTATVMALQFDMVSPENLESVINGLIYNINVIKGGHHSTGIHGNRYIYTVLSKYGNAKLAHDLLTVPTFPSQTYIMNYGFTTWPERQFEWAKVPELSNSLNHPMHSGFAAYFYESLGGIKPNYQTPGFKEFTVNPIHPKEITHTTVAVPTPFGSIKNSWKSDGAFLTMNLEVPFNTTAKVILSREQLIAFEINGLDIGTFERKFYGKISNESGLILGSGTYKLKYKEL